MTVRSSRVNVVAPLDRYHSGMRMVPLRAASTLLDAAALGEAGPVPGRREAAALIEGCAQVLRGGRSPSSLRGSCERAGFAQLCAVCRELGVVRAGTVAREVKVCRVGDPAGRTLYSVMTVAEAGRVRAVSLRLRAEVAGRRARWRLAQCRLIRTRRG